MKQSCLALTLCLAGCAHPVVVGDTTVRIGSSRNELWQALGEPDIVSERCPGAEFFYRPTEFALRQSHGNEQVHYYLRDGVGILMTDDVVRRAGKLSAAERETIERAVAHYESIEPSRSD